MVEQCHGNRGLISTWQVLFLYTTAQLLVHMRTHTRTQTNACAQTVWTSFESPILLSVGSSTSEGDGKASECIGRVFAVDLDRGANGSVAYELAQPDSYFSVDSITGQICLTGVLPTPSSNHVVWVFLFSCFTTVVLSYFIIFYAIRSGCEKYQLSRR